MELFAYAVAYKLADDGKSVFLAVCLNSVADISDAVSRNRLSNAQVERFLRYIQQPLGFKVDFAAREGAGIVAVETVDLCAGVDADNIAGMDYDLMGRDAVDDGVIQTDACRTGKAVQALEVWLCAVLDDKIVNELIEFHGSHTGFDMLTAVLESRRADCAGTAHPLKFFGIFDLDQSDYASTPSASITAAVLSASVTL